MMAALRSARATLAFFCTAGALGAQSAWPVEPRPIVSIASTDKSGALRFAALTWASRPHDELLLVADGSDGSFLFFRPDGELIRKTGRRGRGPGEFARPGWVGNCGTSRSLVGWDVMGARLVQLDTATGETSSQLLPAARGTTELSCNASGEIAVLRFPTPPTDSTPTHGEGVLRNGDSYQLVTLRSFVTVFDSLGREVARIDDLPYGELIAVRESATGRLGAFPRPLGARSSIALRGDTLLIADPHTRLLRAFSLQGVELASHQIALTQRPARAGEYDASAEQLTTTFSPTIKGRFLDVVGQIPPPRTVPTFYRIIADANGVLWFQTTPDGAPRTELRGLIPGKGWVGTLTVNRAFWVFEIRTDHMVGRTVDADGEEVLEVFRFVRPSR